MFSINISSVIGIWPYLWVGIGTIFSIRNKKYINIGKYIELWNFNDALSTLRKILPF